jgi:hypothetical protein
MNRGGRVDIVTGKPIEPKKANPEKARMQEDKLANLAMLANIDQAAATKEVVAILERVLIDEIEKQITQDPACKMALDIIRRIGGVKHSAKSLARMEINKYGGFPPTE